MHDSTVVQIIDQLQSTYPGLQLLVKTSGDTLDLDILVVPASQRRQGVGRSVMEAIASYADLNELMIKLQPDDVFGTPKNQLISFYQKFGFRVMYTKTDNGMVIDSMLREPVKLSRI